MAVISVRGRGAPRSAKLPAPSTINVGTSSEVYVLLSAATQRFYLVQAEFKGEGDEFHTDDDGCTQL